MARRIPMTAVFLSVIVSQAVAASAQDRAEFRYEAKGDVQTYKGRYEFRLEGGVLIVTHYGQNFQGLNLNAPLESIQAPKASPAFLVRIGEQLFLLSPGILAENAVNKFNLGPDVTEVAIDPFMLSAEVRINGAAEAKTVTGPAGSEPYEIPLEALPQATVEMMTQQGPEEREVPLLIEQARLDYSRSVLETAEFSYEHASPNLPNGRFSFQLDGNTLTVKHIAEAGLGFLATGGVEAAPDAVEFVVSYGETVIILNSHDFLMHGELNYSLTSEPAQVAISLSNNDESPYELDYRQLQLRNKNPGPQQPESIAGEPMIVSPGLPVEQPKNLSVYAVRSLETGAIYRHSPASDSVELRYEAFGEVKQNGLFEFRLEGKDVVIRHKAANAYALNPKTEAPVSFNPRFMLYFNNKMTQVELPGEAFASGELRLTLPEEPNGHVDVAVPADVKEALFHEPKGRIANSTCPGSFDPS